MKKSVLILLMGLIVLSCSKKGSETQTDTADTIAPGTVPVQPDTMSNTAIPEDSPVTTIPEDSAQTTR